MYKDEGGKYAYHHTMRASLSFETRTVSIAAYAQCRDARCAQRSDISDSPPFLSDQLFSVRECSRAGFKGPLLDAPVGVRVWQDKANVWSYKTFMDKEVVIKCNFMKVTSKCMCSICGGETLFKIAVATDSNSVDTSVDTSLPICVMSKRKIPASMRKKSQREIEAFIVKARKKKAANTQKREGAKAAPIQTHGKKATWLLKRKRVGDVANPAIRAMTFKENQCDLQMRDASIKNLTLKIKSLEAELADKKQALAAHGAGQASKRRKFIPGGNGKSPTASVSSAKLPVGEFYAQLSHIERAALGDDDFLQVEPIPLYVDTLGDFPQIDGKLDFREWDL